MTSKRIEGIPTRLKLSNARIYYSLQSYLQETIYFLDTLNNLCIWFRFLTKYIHYLMYLKIQLSLVNRTRGSIKKKR